MLRYFTLKNPHAPINKLNTRAMVLKFAVGLKICSMRINAQEPEPTIPVTSVSAVKKGRYFNLKILSPIANTFPFSIRNITGLGYILLKINLCRA